MNDSDSQDSLAEAYDLLTSRLQAGERIDPREIDRRYPRHAAELRRLFPALAALENLSSPDQPGEGAEKALRELGDFRIVREVGRGGMGVVYEAEQLSLGRRVALKVLPFAATMDPRQLQRFHNEARAAASLHHEHIVPVHAVGQERGVHYYAMQFIDGRTLVQVMDDLRGDMSGNLHEAATVNLSVAEAVAAKSRRAAPPPTTVRTALGTSTAPAGPCESGFFRQVTEWAIQAAEALEDAHRVGVVHRDVKPGNLMVDGQGKLWVTDFGLAQTRVDSGLTMTGDLVGTLRYMSPEQARARHGLVDHRTDIYSLGVTLYELLTLRPAVTGQDRLEILRKVAEVEPPPPRTFNRALPRELETVILKAMAKEPSDRYATAGELADDLRRFTADEPVRARRASRWEHGWRWCRRNPSLAGALAAFVLALVGGTSVAGYLAVVADARAHAADTAADQARLSEEKATASALRTREALDEAERTLIESLLRPVGHEPGPPGALELAALEEVAGLPDDQVRLRYLRTGLASVETARRLGPRAEPVVRAVVGLDRRRKKAVEQILLERLGESRQSRETVLACLSVAAALPCEDERLADLGIQLLIEQANRDNVIVWEHAVNPAIVQHTYSFVDPTELQRVLDAADGLTVGLSPARADDRAARVLAALGETTSEKKPRSGPPGLISDEQNVSSLAVLLGALLKRLPPDRAADRANAAVTSILTTARRGTLTQRTLRGGGSLVEVVNYTRRMQLVAGLAPWLTGDQAEAQAAAVVNEMRNAAVDPDKRAVLDNRSHAIRHLAVALRALLPRLPERLAQQHAAEAAGLLLTAWRQESGGEESSNLADGAKDLAAYLPADAAAPVADALGEHLARTTDAQKALRLASGLQALLDRLPAESAAEKAGKVAGPLIAALGEKPVPPTNPDRPGEPKPLLPLAAELNGLLRRLPPDQAAEHAVRAETALIPFLLEAEEVDDERKLAQVIRTLAEHLPVQQAVRLVQPWVPAEKPPAGGGRTGGGVPRPKPGEPRPSPNGPLLIGALAERLPSSTLLALLGGRMSPPARSNLMSVLRGRVERAVGEEADQFFERVLASSPLPESSPFDGPRAVVGDDSSLLKLLADRVSPHKVPKYTDTLVQRITGNLQQKDLLVLVETLDVLLGRLPPEQATDPAGKTVQALVNGVVQARTGSGGASPRTPPSVIELDRPLLVLAHRVSAAEAGPHVEKLLAALPKAKKGDVLCTTAIGIRALADRLPAGEAERAVDRAVPSLRAALNKAETPAEFAKIAATLAALTDRHPVRLDEEHARTAMKWAREVKRGFELPPLAEAHEVILSRLPVDAVATHADALAAFIVEAAEKTNSPLDLLSLSRSMRLIGRHLGPGSPYPEALAARLSRAWDEAPEEILTEQIGEAVRESASLLTAAQAARTADRVLTALKKATPRDRKTLAEVHEALIERLPETQARPRRITAILASLRAEAVDRSRSVGARKPPTIPGPWTLPSYLRPPVAACTDKDLLDVLRSPSCTGDAQTWFLAELGRRRGCEFRSAWDVVGHLEPEE